MLRLRLHVDDPDVLRALIERDLVKRRAFVPGASGVDARTPCDLVLAHAGRTHTLAAEVVYVRSEDPGRGVGLALASLDAEALAHLRAFAEGSDQTSAADTDGPGDETVDSRGLAEADPPTPMRLHDRLIALSGVEQQKLAATGTLPERIALERMFGPNVWDTLLQNPRLTLPEVARIARKGTLPRSLLEVIAANASWLASGEVQRALLSNPRSPAPVIEKALRALPRRDLQRVPAQTAYTMAVRMAAKKLLGG